MVVEVSLTFLFSTSSNQAEYEACIAGLQLAKDFNVAKVQLLTDSLLVVSQIKEEYDAKHAVLQRYLARVREMLKLFLHVEVKHVPRGENSRAESLSKLASTKSLGNLKSIIQETLSRSSVSLDVGSASVACFLDARLR